MIVVFFLFIVGTGVGSFICATVQVEKSKPQKKRSRCDKCKRVLKWSDLLPVLSYLVLRGKCRYCKSKIDPKTLWVEILTGCLFALSYLWLPVGVWRLVVWLVILSLFLSLFLSDLFYQKLPFIQIVFLTLFCSIFLVLTDVNIDQKMYSITLLNHFFSLIILTGVFGIAYLITKGKKIGLGDVLLSIPIAILLPWQGGLAVLLLAPVLSIIFYLSSVIKNKKVLDIKIPFGSFLILATLMVFFIMEPLVNFF
jgi:prepilin signal peptidase PulO-like enzyme (type II secretory pathway)